MHKMLPSSILLLLALGLILPHPLLAQETISLVNPSFEEPGVQEQNWANIPGWTIDGSPANSGVGNNPGVATDGEWIAWLMSDDNAIWQLTDYTIQAGDVFTLTADVRNSWQTTTFDLILYYDDNGTRVTAATTTPDFQGIVEAALAEFSVSFSTADVPDAVGHLLGVAIDNTSGPDSFIEMDNFRLTRSTATATEEAEDVPSLFTLDQNYPNPFNPVTTIAYALPVPEHVTVQVFDMLGREVATLVDARQPAGRQEVQFDAGTLPSGVYVYQLRAGAFTAVKMLTVLK